MASGAYGENSWLGQPRDGDVVKMIYRTAIAATIGGSASSLTGGQFANGAVTAAMQHLFNAEGSTIKAALARLRGIPEFAALEQKCGQLTLSFDNSKVTGLTGNNININKSIFDTEYRVDTEATIGAFQESLSADLSDTSYWAAIDAFEAGVPSYNAFSVERVIVHEAFHLTQGNVSGLQYHINSDFYESPIIRSTNAFMFKHFNEPYRVEIHGDVRSR